MMTPGRFVRLVLDSFYHCGNRISDASDLAKDLARGVAACDFAVEHVEKAVAWRLQQPETTTAALFINAFQLNWDQVHNLLRMGADLNASSPTADQDLNSIACQWLIQNPGAWQEWMPTLDGSVLHAWPLWLGFCGLCFFLIFYEAGMYFWGLHRESRWGVVIKRSAPEVEANAQHRATPQFKWAQSCKFPNGLLNEVLASMKDPLQQATFGCTSPEASESSVVRDSSLSNLVPHIQAGLDERSSGSSSSSTARLALISKFRDQFRPVFHFLREACRWCFNERSSYQIYAFALGQVGAQVSIGKYLDSACVCQEDGIAS